MEHGANDALSIPAHELGAGTNITVKVVPTDTDLYFDVAHTMLHLIQANNARGQKSSFIVPVGPVGQYERLAELLNMYDVDCHSVYIINMDEYLADGSTAYISYRSPLSFRRFMDEHFYKFLRPTGRIPAENRVFPDPVDPNNIARFIEKAGGVDMCIGGIGITGHVAFNEPPRPPMSVDAFGELGTRVIDIAEATRVINSVTAMGGNIDAIPRRGVTVGMKEILGARSIRIYMNRPWQRTIARKWIHGPITSEVPASLLQRHPDVRVVLTEEAAQPPASELR